MADPKSTFLNVYSVLKKELLQDPAFEWSPDSREWVERIVSRPTYLCSFVNLGWRFCLGSLLKYLWWTILCLEVACALLMAGENLDNHVDVKNILVEMGTFFQVEDDCLDCFGDPEIIGKGMEICNEEQKKLLHENYGKPDPANEAQVKAHYNDLNLQGVFPDYESKTY
ncbi:hypothetical protein NC653_035689 [Populus alba x Populus x berolinensis]|uniref:Farnesyl diphosphate synthase n=1 Tax=Populus alba x Populus x berolinensis TaxID=444605 RepID=A0AAD6LIA0_9ROSI|nr:hypothetical protein NC653_035689 [Populus alba x Populus x berolinensis]